MTNTNHTLDDSVPLKKLVPTLPEKVKSEVIARVKQLSSESRNMFLDHYVKTINNLCAKISHVTIMFDKDRFLFANCPLIGLFLIARFSSWNERLCQTADVNPVKLLTELVERLFA